MISPDNTREPRHTEAMRWRRRLDSGPDSCRCVLRALRTCLGGSGGTPLLPTPVVLGRSRPDLHVLVLRPPYLTNYGVGGARIGASSSLWSIEIPYWTIR